MTRNSYAQIPKYYLEQLVSRIDLLELAREYVPELKRTGDSLTGCCPFHSEKTASFHVYPDHYHCYGCGAHGDAIGFIRQVASCNFPDAVAMLSQRAGMEMPKTEQQQTPEMAEEAKRFAANCTALREAQKSYAWWLGKVPEGMEYLKKRGLTDETIAKFGIGYALERKNVIAESKFINKDAAVAAGLVVVKDDEKRFDRFRHRVMFPIYKGKRDPAKDYIIGFGGRAIGDQDAKYLNSPETEFFTKGENLYGLPQALASKKTASRIFAVEGYMDAVMLSQYGVENVVATMGTAVTEAQIRKLMRTSTRITFCMDGDGPGIKAAAKIAEAVLPHLNDVNTLDFMILPGGEDPDEFVRAHGLDAFLAEAENATGASDFLIDTLKKSEDTTTSAGMARYLAAVNKCAEQIVYPPINLAFKNRAAEVAGISLDAFLKMSATEVPAEPQPAAAAPAGALPDTPAGIAAGISVAARMLGLSVAKDYAVAADLDLEFIGKFMTPQDREMLFPLVLNVRMNPGATLDALVASLTYNPHIAVIRELAQAAQLLDDKFDAKVEAKTVITGFRKMQRVWQILEQNGQTAAAAVA